MGTPRLHTTIRSFAPLFLVAALGTTGCAADTDDEAPTGESTAAWTANPTYDAAMKRSKITTTPTPGSAFSATTTLVGYIPDDTADDTLKKLFGVRSWTQVTAEDGSKVFSAARVIADDNRSPIRTVRANVTFPGSIAIDTKLVGEKQADGSQKVTITNTTGYYHWFAGQVLDPGKFVIELKIIPYKDGVIVDARARVKLNSQEGQAPEITSYIVPIFDWLKQN
jgi:hypothetical protein